MNKDLLWKIIYKNLEPDEEGLREVICALGNGYFGTRGAATEALPAEMHYPGTYIAGLYNRLATYISGRTVYNEDLVNCPNWTYLTFKIRDSEWFCPSTAKIISFRKELDMKNGVLVRDIRFKTRRGYRTRIIENRIVHMAYPHIGAISYAIIPENYSDYITVRSMLDGAVLNMNVERYRQLNSNHWIAHKMGQFADNGIYLSAKTSSSRIEICEASKLRVFAGNKEKNPRLEVIRHAEKVIGQEFRIFAQRKHPCLIEKTVAIYTSRDKGVRDPKVSAINAVKKLKRFETLISSHKQAWFKLWDKFDIQVEGDAFAQQVLRLHIFHLLQTASVHNREIDAGLSARGLHGEAYRGHVFWDEIFVKPFYTLHTPEISKALIMYRYRRLPKAREYARANGYRGAMFPWQSGSSGREETQVMHLNPRSGKWGPDYSYLQRHVSVAIAYNVWNYWRLTKDEEFLEKVGAEMILSIAQFCASIAKFSAKDDRFHVGHVMGPDEFHEKLPNSHQAGFKDNAYTNFMMVWTLLKAREVLKIISYRGKSRIMKKLKITPKELKVWNAITKKMNLVINNEGIISQFDGYMQLKELVWSEYRKRYKNIKRMDRILKAEGKSPDAYKVSKQADALMIFYLFPLPQVQEIFNRLGYPLNRQLLARNYDYYIARTSHGSTLSKVVHCFLSKVLGRQKDFWLWFVEILKSDIYDTQGGTTPEGIHCGVMGGSIDIVVRCFAGIELGDEWIKLRPQLPDKWRRLKFKIYFQGKWILFDITKSQVKIHIQKGKRRQDFLAFEINSKLQYLNAGRTFKFSLKNR